MRRNVTLMALVFAALIGCGNGATNAGPCAPNEQVECACGNDVMGYQVCNADGSAYSECQCNGGQGGSASTSSGGGTGSTGGAGGLGSGGAPPMLPAYCQTGADVTYNCADCPIGDSIVDGSGLCNRFCDITPRQEDAWTVNASVDGVQAMVFPKPEFHWQCDKCGYYKMNTSPEINDADWSYGMRIIGKGCAKITGSAGRSFYYNTTPGTGDYFLCGVEAETASCKIITQDNITASQGAWVTAISHLTDDPGWIRIETQSAETSATCTLSCP